MDLASLFCLIGRHGPAVAVAVVALVSVLAGFIIYRSVSGKRRKAAAADRDGRDGPGPGDASVIRASLEGSRSSAESTGTEDPQYNNNKYYTTAYHKDNISKEYNADNVNISSAITASYKAIIHSGPFVKADLIY